MFKATRNTILVKILWGFMAIYLLNISADTEDLPTTSVHENLAINDQESFVEIVVEQILGFENAFAEFNNAEPQDFLIKKANKAKTQLFQDIQLNPWLEGQKIIGKAQHFFIAHTLSGFTSLEHPPPEHLI